MCWNDHQAISTFSNQSKSSPAPPTDCTEVWESNAGVLGHVCRQKKVAWAVKPGAWAAGKGSSNFLSPSLALFVPWYYLKLAWLSEGEHQNSSVPAKHLSNRLNPWQNGPRLHVWGGEREMPPLYGMIFFSNNSFCQLTYPWLMLNINIMFNIMFNIMLNLGAILSYLPHRNLDVCNGSRLSHRAYGLLRTPLG